MHQQQLAAPAAATEKGDSELTITEDPFLRQFYALLEAHYSDSTLSVERLATLSAMSQRTLNRKLNALLGLPPVEVLR